MEIIESKKNGQKLCHDGFMYTKCFNKCRTKLWWRCAKRASHKCRGSLTTDTEGENPLKSQLHNHDPDPEQIELEKIKMNQRKKRQQSEDNKGLVKKQKADTEESSRRDNNNEDNGVKEEKECKVESHQSNNETQMKSKRAEGRSYTVSIAVPASVLDIPQTHELKTCLVGQIARAAAVNNVDEIVVFDDSNTMIKSTSTTDNNNRASRNCALMLKLLEYLECPQYLRKYFFPIQPDLRFAGLLNPLDAPHQMRADDLRSAYREGVIVKKEVREGQGGSYANVGLYKDCWVDRSLIEGVRCTVKVDNYQAKKLRGRLVSCDEPRSKAGMYWGYKTRLAVGLTEVIEGGYDCVVGTSDKGTSIDHFTLPSFKNLLVVFGGVQGLESCIESDEHLLASTPQQLFKHYINSRPNQGSATIRTEEAILITLASLRPQIESNSITS